MSPTDTTRAQFFRSKRSTALLGEFVIERTPRHVAIIMDGNGRWAAKRALPRLAGHSAGAKAVREAIAAAIELQVEFLTIYSFSSENWNRPQDEVSGLMRLFVEVLERELTNLNRMNVRVEIIGRMDGVPTLTRDAFERVVSATASNSGLTLVVALNYGSRAEITDAARSLAQDVADGRLVAQDITDAMLSARLYTTAFPDPDLIIRTSGELRLSNFLLWQAAYSELWVTATLWPDFSRADFLRAVVDYQHRVRRFGGS